MNEMYNRIEALLKRRGMTFNQLSVATGVSNGRFTDLKNGRAKTLSTKNLKQVSEYLGVTPEYLEYGDRKTLVQLDLDSELVNTKMLVRLMSDDQLHALLLDLSQEIQRRNAEAHGKE